MKKLFTFIAALLSVAAINATQIVLNPKDMPQLTTAGKYDQTISGVKVEISNGIVNESQIRIYKNQTITFTAENSISAIVFTCTASGDAQYGPGCFEEQAGYSYSVNKGTWDGSATSVSFLAKSNQVRATKIVVYMDGEKPSSEAAPIDTISVTEARARIDKGEKDACYIKGVVAGDPFELSNMGPAFYLTDIVNSQDSIEGFKIAKSAEATYANAEEMAQDFTMGDTILIFATGLDMYKTTYETTGGYFAEMLGKSSAIVLDWTDGRAKYAESDSTWTLTIKKEDLAEGEDEEDNLLSFIFKSDKNDAIAGFHKLAAGSTITYNKQEFEITSGSITLTYKKINNDNYNVYKAVATIVAGDKMYRLQTDNLAVGDKGNKLLGDRPFVPAEGQEITCAQAKEFGLSLEKGAESEITVTITGYVTDMFTNGDARFWMDDQKGSTKTVQVYFYKTVTPAGQIPQNGAEVKVTGKIQHYFNTKNNESTIEITNSNVEIVSGGQTIVADIEVNVAGAIAATDSLDQNKTSNKYFGITGYVADIDEAYKNGNMSFWMSDEQGDGAHLFLAYRVNCSEELAAKLVPGAKVKVIDKLKKFHQDAEPAKDGQPEKPARDILETNGGGIVELLEEAAVEDITSNVPATKFFRNGQIFILRNGVLYNMQGQIAE